MLLNHALVMNAQNWLLMLIKLCALSE